MQTCPARMCPGRSEPDTPALPSFHTRCPQAAAPHPYRPRQLPGAGRAQARLPCHLPAPFSTIYTKPQIKAIGEQRVRPSMTQGGDGDKERGRKLHQIQREKNQPSAGKAPLMGACALLPAKATSQNHVYQTNNVLITPMPPCPGSSGKPRSCGIPRLCFGRALSMAGSSGHWAGLAEHLRERKIFAVFLVC